MVSILQIASLNSYSTLTIGLFLNFFLQFLVYKYSTNELREYSGVLRYLAFWNISLLISQALTQPLYFVADNSFSYVFAHGIVAFCPSLPIRNALMTAYFVCWNQVILCSALQFLNRYLTICREWKSRFWRFTLLGSIAIFFGLAEILIDVTALPAEDVQIEDILSQVHAEFLAAENGSLRLGVSIVYDPKNPIQKFSYCLIFAEVIFCYTTDVICFLKIRTFVKKNLPESFPALRKKTLIQISLNMILQSFLPFLCTLIVAFAVISLLFGTNQSDSTAIKFVMLIFVPFDWLPIFDPIITILIINEYRASAAALFQKLPICGKIWGQQGRSISIVVSSSQRNGTTPGNAGPVRMFERRER